MRCSMWDKRNKKWIEKENVRYVVMIDNTEFKLDDIVYDTSRYELTFIHDGV